MDGNPDALKPGLRVVVLQDRSEPGSDEDWPIGDVARRFGVTLRALRFYEEKGLLAARREGAVRLYGAAMRERLGIILQAKRLGFTLAEIRQMLAAPDRRAAKPRLNLSRQQCFEQIKLLEQRKREIEAALAELRRAYSAFYAATAGRPG